MSTTSRSVQYEGIDTVLRMYQSRGVAPWAVFCNTQFMFNYSGKEIKQGVDELATVLDSLQDVGSPAVYTLKVYEDLKGKIKSNTPDDGSFNFRICPAAVGTVASYRGSGREMQLESEVRALKLQVEKMLADDDGDDDAERDIVGTIERVMQIPGVSQLASAFMGFILPTPAPRAMAGVPDVVTMGAESVVHPGADQLYISESVLQSLSILLKVPNAEEKFARLAVMAKNEPAKFNMLLGML